jgi:hypothetical protein
MGSLENRRYSMDNDQYSIIIEIPDRLNFQWPLIVGNCSLAIDFSRGGTSDGESSREEICL